MMTPLSNASHNKLLKKEPLKPQMTLNKKILPQITFKFLPVIFWRGWRGGLGGGEVWCFHHSRKSFEGCHRASLKGWKLSRAAALIVTR